MNRLIDVNMNISEKSYTFLFCNYLYIKSRPTVITNVIIRAIHSNFQLELKLCVDSYLTQCCDVPRATILNKEGKMTKLLAFDP